LKARGGDEKGEKERCVLPQAPERPFFLSLFPFPRRCPDASSDVLKILNLRPSGRGTFQKKADVDENIASTGISNFRGHGGLFSALFPTRSFSAVYAHHPFRRFPVRP
jgi:hypothetical protein